MDRLPVLFLGTAGALLHRLFQYQQSSSWQGRKASSTVTSGEAKHQLQMLSVLWLATTLSAPPATTISSETNEDRKISSEAPSVVSVYAHGIFLASISCIVLSAWNNSNFNRISTSSHNGAGAQPHQNGQRNRARFADGTSSDENMINRDCSSSYLSSSYFVFSPAMQQRQRLRVISGLVAIFNISVPSCWAALLVQTVAVADSTGNTPTDTTSIISSYGSLIVALATFATLGWIQCQQQQQNRGKRRRSIFGETTRQSHDLEQSSTTPVIRRRSFCPQPPFGIPLAAAVNTATPRTSSADDASDDHHYRNSHRRVATTAALPSIMVDESCWYSWSVAESMEWIYQQFASSEGDRSMGLDEGGSIAETVVAAVGPECMTCWQMSRISPVDLRLVTGLPYGLALQLHQTIHDELARKHAVPQSWLGQQHEQQDNVSTGSHASAANHSSSWLAQHDREYNNHGNDKGHPRSKQGSSFSNGGPDAATNVLVSSIDDSQQEQASRQSANQVMQERFGLELPEMHSSQTNNTARDPLAPPQAQLPLQPNSKQPPKRQQQTERLWPELPPEFMANMPPHISEIVKRKPELVQKILMQHQEQKQRLLSQQQSVAPATARRQEEEESAASHLQIEDSINVVEDNQNHHDNHDNDNNNDDEEETSDGEMTELLLRHRRRKRQGSLYESTT